MPDTAITAAELGADIDYCQTTKPRTMTGSFVADDTDYHAMKLNMRTQGGLLYAIDNPSNKDVVVTLYGMFVPDGEVGNTKVFAIDDTGFTVAATDKGYEITGDKFPYYLIRLKFAAVPDGETVTVYAVSKES